MAFSDDFSAYPQGECFTEGAAFGRWTLRFDGEGCVSVVAVDEGAALSLAPKTSIAADETHSALVVGPRFDGEVGFSCGVTTAQQLRENTAPNAWEAAWLVWSYTDDDHFYYFIAKAIGWELGKRDPAYEGGQRFLRTGDDPTFEIGTRAVIHVSQTGAAMDVAVNGASVVSFTDEERPYRTGRIGFYAEDAVALFDDVHAHGT